MCSCDFSFWFRISMNWINFWAWRHYKSLNPKGSSISCALPVSRKQAESRKPKAPATFQQTKRVIMFPALGSFDSARQIQRALISFQLPNLLTSSFSFSLSRAFWTNWPISPLFQISAGTSGSYSQCPLTHKSFDGAGWPLPSPASKCNKSRSARKERCHPLPFIKTAESLRLGNRSLSQRLKKNTLCWILLLKMSLLYNKQFLHNRALI